MAEATQMTGRKDCHSVQLYPIVIRMGMDMVYTCSQQKYKKYNGLVYLKETLHRLENPHQICC